MEMWDARDKYGNKLGYTVGKMRDLPKGIYHLGVDVWLKNRNNEYLIQRRALEKNRMPGIWMSTGGSALSGENGLDAACREVEEELGIQLKRESILRLFFNLHSCNYCEVFLVQVDIDLSEIDMQPKEVMAVKFVPFSVIVDLIRNGEMLPYSEEYLTAIFNEEVLGTVVIESN